TALPTGRGILYICGEAAMFGRNSTRHMHSGQPYVIIAGCGSLGREAARRLAAAGATVTGLSRSPEAVPGVRGVPVDLADTGACLAAADAIAATTADPPDIVFCASSARGGGAAGYRSIYVDGLRNVMAAFPRRRHLVFTGSTSVYAQTDGSEVTEDSPAEPARETGQILREA